MFWDFSLKLYMANHSQCVLVLLVQKLRDKLNNRKTKFALNVSFQKVIWMLAVRGRKNLTIHYFYFKILVSYGLIANSKSFNLMTEV